MVAGILGCVEAPRSERVGYISIPLTATGASGAIYRLPPGSVLLLTNASFGAVYSVDGDGDVLTAVVPPGDYSVFLTDFAGDTTVWPLIRENPDGRTETVLGTLDLAPTITVVEDQTTSLVIRFHVAVVGPITFGRGVIEVSVEVDETSLLALDIDIVVSSLSVQSTDIGETAPAALAPRLPGPGDSGDSYRVHLSTVGSWVAFSPGTVCIPVTASVEASGNAGFIDLVAEAPPSGSEQLCITQLNHFALMHTSFIRQGDASTELLADLDGAPYLVTHGILANIPGDVYDGRTLHLEALSGTRELNMLVDGAIFATVDSPFGPIFQSWYQINEFGVGLLTLTGR